MEFRETMCLNFFESGVIAISIEPGVSVRGLLFWKKFGMKLSMSIWKIFVTFNHSINHLYHSINCGQAYYTPKKISHVGHPNRHNYNTKFDRDPHFDQLPIDSSQDWYNFNVRASKENKKRYCCKSIDLLLNIKLLELTPATRDDADILYDTNYDLTHTETVEYILMLYFLRTSEINYLLWQVQNLLFLVGHFDVVEY